MDATADAVADEIRESHRRFEAMISRAIDVITSINEDVDNIVRNHYRVNSYNHDSDNDNNNSDNDNSIYIDDDDSDTIYIDDDDSNISVFNTNSPPVAELMDVDAPEVIDLDVAERVDLNRWSQIDLNAAVPFNGNRGAEISLDAPQGLRVLEDRWLHSHIRPLGGLHPIPPAIPIVNNLRRHGSSPVVLNAVPINVDSDEENEEQQESNHLERLFRRNLHEEQESLWLEELKQWQKEQIQWQKHQDRIKLMGEERLQVHPEFIPEGNVLLMLTGATNQQPGESRRLRIFLVQRQQRSACLTRSNTSSTRDQNLSLQNIIHTSIPMPPNCLNQIRIFIHLHGVSQKMKIMDRNKIYASYETRYNSFKRCHMSLLQKIPALSESGLYYMGNGHDDGMICYCCGSYFTGWQHVVDPWVKHAIRSPDCTLLRLYKGTRFVESVHEKFDYMKYCTFFEFQMKFYKLFSVMDTNILNCSNGSGDLRRRALIIDQMVSVAINRLYPTSLSQTTIDLNRPPLPNNITCKICYREKIDVLFVPCGHMMTCSQCAVTLHECAICREPFGTTTYALKVTIQEEQKYQLTQRDIDDNDLMCRVCKEKTIEMAFVPCLHVHTCYECSITSETCPVCFESFYGLIQVFLS